MTTLDVLAGGSEEAVGAYQATPFDLGLHPLRPGLAHAAVTLTLEAELAEAVEHGAAREGVPTPLWVGLAIESERAVRALAEDTGIAAQTLERTLGAAALHTANTLAAQRGRRLARYALALRNSPPRAADSPRRRLTIGVPQHTLAAWELAAEVERKTVVDWAVLHLEHLPTGRARWEAVAAQAGQTLGEWIAVQAARRSSN